MKPSGPPLPISTEKAHHREDANLGELETRQHLSRQCDVEAGQAGR